MISYLLELNVILLTSLILITGASVLLSVSDKGDSLSTVFNLLNLNTFFISFAIHLVILYLFLFTSNWGLVIGHHEVIDVFTGNLFLQNHSVSLDFFGLMLITLAYVVGFISMLSFNEKLIWESSKQSIIFNFFLLTVIAFTTCDHMVSFFIFYEFLLIPSFIIVFYSSSNNNSTQASLYFLIWTQTGSTLVLAAIMQLVRVDNIEYFNQLVELNFYTDYTDSLKLLIFIGFGFNIPVWPLYYWLTNTHVEATGAFSMYLSGFLVNTALYGLYNFFLNIDWSETNLVMLSVAVMGVVISSFQMWAQVDLNNIIALCTVQEMNLLLICFIFGQTPIVYAGVMFSFMHALLSTLMFFLVDLVQNSFNTSVVTNLSGIIHLAPNLGLSIVAMCLLFLALPFTLKFTCEFMLLGGLLDISSLTLVLVCLVINWVAPISFCNAWYSVLFGTPSSKFYNVMDLDLKEVATVISCIVLLVVPAMSSIAIL